MYRERVTQFLCSETEPIAETRQGKLHGFQVNGTYHFLGVKYADAKRFHMPEDPAPWDGVRDALEYGYCCPEVSVGEPWGWYLLPRRKYFQNENCQYLNIWTQHMDSEAKRPVMVWIHGGGYFGGSGIDLEAYDGEGLSRTGDTVVITLNHRLNLLGFMNLSAYGKQYENSANLGIADLVAALKWIHENISAFGGDPDNVTLFGQSGGGGKICALMQTPAADGLYHKCIIQSGVIGETDFKGSEIIAKGVVEELGLTEETISEIETLPYETIVRAAAKVTYAYNGRKEPLSWAPVPGNYYYGNAITAGFRKETLNIPVIVGSNLFEFDGNDPVGNKKNLTEEQITEMLKPVLGEKTEKVKTAFEKAYPELSAAYAGCVDMRFRSPSLHYLEKRSRFGAAPCYAYIFTYECDFKGGMLPGHGGELPFTLCNADHNVMLFKEGVSERLQNQMSGSWLRFAVTGDPNGKGLPEWTPFTDKDGACMAFGDTTVLKHHHDDELVELLNSEEFRGAIL